MSLDAEAIKQELQQLNHQRHEVNERLRSLAPTRGRGGFRGGRGLPPPALAHPSARRDYPPRDHPARDYPPRDHDSRDMGRDVGAFAREPHNPLDRLPPRRPFPGRGGPWEQEPPHLEAPPEGPAPRRRVQSAVVVEGSVRAASDNNGREYADGDGSSERGGRSSYEGGSGSGAGGAGNKRPAEGELLEDNPALKRRNRRLFGALLGTLQKFKEETQRESSSDVAQRRAELLQRAEQKKEEAARRLREEARQEMQSKMQGEINRKREINMLSDTKRLELLYAEKLARHDRLSTFLKTKTGPSVLWCPRQHSHITLRLQEQQRQELQLWKAEQLEQLEREKAELRQRYERATSRGEALGHEGGGHGEGEEGHEEEGHEGEGEGGQQSGDHAGALGAGPEAMEGVEGQQHQQQEQQEQPAADDRYEAEPRGEGDEQQAEEAGEAEKEAAEAADEGPAGDGEQQVQEQPSSPAEGEAQ